MTVKQELLALKNKDGFFPPEQILAWAESHPKSRIYAQLTWDNRKAGHQYRLFQVRQLIAVHVRFDGGERQLVSLKFDRSPDRGYRDVNDVLNDRSLTQMMLEEALAELDRVQVKYDRLKELRPVWQEKEKVAKRARRSKRGSVERSIVEQRSDEQSRAKQA